MNKKTLVWTLIVAVPVGIAALATAYVYRDTGKLPFETATGPAPESAAGTAQPQPAAEAQNLAETKPAETDTASARTESAQPASKGPSFDVVGVEPTGETVVAGRSEAGAIVALTANGKVVGKSIANEVGEWTIILDEPLKPGDYDVGLEVHDEAGEAVSKSEEHVVVSLPEGGKQQPLVVLNTPEGPSDILQKPAAEQQVAEAGPATTVETPAAAADTGTAAAAPETGTRSADTKPAEVAAVEQAGTGTAETEPAAAQTPAAAADAASEPQPAAPAAQQDVAAADAETPAPAAAEVPADAETTVAAVTPEAQAETSGTSDVETQASSEASGAGEPAEATEVAAATAEAPASGSAPVSEETQAAAADGEAGNETAGTAPVETAAAAPATGKAPEPASEPSETAPAATAEAAPAKPTVTVEAVESETDKVYVAGTGEPGSSVRVYVGDEYQGEAQVNASGKWLVQGGKNIAEGNVEVRADLIGEDGNSVDARAAVTFEKEQDKQIVLTKVVASGASSEADGQGAEVRKALPVVIIRKGDNLWRISRRLYGEGVRYTTIYQANQDQIRNPDLIYPGQVFLTPEGDLNWPKPVENNG